MADATAELDASLEETQHTFFFSNHLSLMPDPQELGAMISSYGRLLKTYQKVLARIDPDFEDSFIVPDLILYHASGSGLLEWVVKLCWGDEKKAEKWAKTLLDKNPKLKWLAARKKGIGAIILGLIAVAPLAAKLKGPSGDDSDEKTPHLSGIQQQTINIGASTYGIKPEEFKRYLIETLQNDPSLLRDVSRVVRPVRRDPDAHMTFDRDDQALTLKADAIAEIPMTFKADSKPREAKKIDVQILLRATDLDNKRRWAGIIPSLSPKRVILVVDVENTAQLAGVASLRGDIVVEEVQDDGDWIPVKYRLTAIQSTDRQPNLYHPATGN